MNPKERWCAPPDHSFDNTSQVADATIMQNRSSSCARLNKTRTDAMFRRRRFRVSKLCPPRPEAGQSTLRSVNQSFKLRPTSRVVHLAFGWLVSSSTWMTYSCGRRCRCSILAVALPSSRPPDPTHTDFQIFRTVRPLTDNSWHMLWWGTVAPPELSPDSGLQLFQSGDLV
jgi:hypothetical protein